MGVSHRLNTLRVAPGGLRDRLTFRHWRVDRPLDGGLARQPALCIISRNMTAQDRCRRCTVERPSEAATGSSRRIVNRVRRCSPVKEWIAGVTAGPGEAGWNPVDAHTRRPSWRSPFDPIEGDAPRRGDLLFPGGRAGIPVASEANLTEAGRNPAKPDMSVSDIVRRNRMIARPSHGACAESQTACVRHLLQSRRTCVGNRP